MDSERAGWITLEAARVCLRAGTGRGVKIAVLDSGIDVGHPMLAGMNLVEDIAIVQEGQRLRTAAGEGRDVYGHGTAVASIIREVAPEAEIGSIRVLGERLASRTAIIREGAHQAIERGYDIVNCSFGCGVPEHVLEYKEWVDLAYLRGAHVVAACNNFDHTMPEWPGYFTSVVTVKMLAPSDGDVLRHVEGTLVEFAAPGTNLRVPWRGQEYREMSGSSFAAPRVTGILARLISGWGALNPLVAKAVLRQMAPLNDNCLRTAEEECGE